MQARAQMNHTELRRDEKNMNILVLGVSLDLPEDMKTILPSLQRATLLLYSVHIFDLWWFLEGQVFE